MSVRFFLDEDVQVFLGEALRARGVDALHTYEAGRGGEPDEAQLAFATGKGWCLVTYNRRDFVAIARRFAEGGHRHAGIIVAVRRAPGDVLRALVALAAAHTGETIRDQLLYV